jgi:hypothetical protein
MYYALFQNMRFDLCREYEARLTKSLEHKKRMRERDRQLKEYLNVVSETVQTLKQNRSFYYD